MASSTALALASAYQRWVVRMSAWPISSLATCGLIWHSTMTAYAVAHPGERRQTDADPDTGCMEFVIRKGRFSFRLTAPYSAERRRAASEAAKKSGVNDIGRSVHKNLL